MSQLVIGTGILTPPSQMKLPEGITEAIRNLRKFKVSFWSQQDLEKKTMEIQAVDESDVKECLLEMPDVGEFEIEEVLAEAKLDPRKI